MPARAPVPGPDWVRPVQTRSASAANLIRQQTWNLCTCFLRRLLQRVRLWTPGSNPDTGNRGAVERMARILSDFSIFRLSQLWQIRCNTQGAESSPERLPSGDSRKQQASQGGS